MSLESFAMRQLPGHRGIISSGLMVPVGHSSPSQRPNPILRSEYRQQGCLAAFDQGLFYLDTHVEHIAHQRLVVPVQKGNLAAFQLEVAERLMEGQAMLPNGLAQRFTFRVAVAEDEVRGKRAKSLDNASVLDVATVQNQVHAVVL